MIRGAPELGMERVPPWNLYALSTGEPEHRRKLDEPMPAGHVVNYPGARFELLEATLEGNPLVVEATLDHPLEDPGYLWVTWDVKGYIPF